MWATKIPDPRGVRKDRPVLVLTPTDEIADAELIVGAAIATSFPEPPPYTHIALPWAADGSVKTGLRRRSAAVCNWLVKLEPGKIEPVKGYLDARRLADVMGRVIQLHLE